MPLRQSKTRRSIFRQMSYRLLCGECGIPQFRITNPLPEKINHTRVVQPTETLKRAKLIVGTQCGFQKDSGPFHLRFTMRPAQL